MSGAAGPRGGGVGGGLLGAPSFADLSSLAPPPAYTRPVLQMSASGLQLGGDDVLARLMENAPDIADPLARYEAGLQPSISPAGTPWQQEVVFDRIARDDRDLQQQIQFYWTAARSYDTMLSRQRMRASDYYNGLALGDEEPGRSHLVLTTVRDTIRATLPSLLRMFTAVENPVEFTPAIADNEQLGLMHAQLAQQATQYARWALFTANNGWVVLHDAILDALTRKVGWVRWYWGQQRASRVEECERLLLPQLQMLLQEPGITAQRIVRRPMLPNEIRAVAATQEGAAYLQGGGPPIFYGARLTRTAAQAWPQVEYVPSESVWIVADADQVATARAVFHVRDTPASNLIAAGLPADKVMRSAAEPVSMQRQRESRNRDPNSLGPLRGAPPNDPSMKYVRYTEGWCQMDTDGDGVAELVHVHCVGNSPQLIRWDRTDEVPLSGFTPYREPGRVVGFSQADMVTDLQRTETRVMRAVLDSLGQSIFPRTVVQVGATNIEDARQTAIGAIIRVTQQGAVTELTKPFIGAQALPVLELLEAVREGRTGITRTSQGLTADALQSTTPTAVDAQTGASQDRIDMIARTLAETGLVPLYQGLLRMMARHQDRPNVIAVRGKWIAVDPRALSILWMVQCNIGGKGTPAERLGLLGAIAAKQEQILAPAVQQGMLDTPLVGLPEYRNTLARMCEVAGISDVVSYFKELPPGWQPPPPPPPQPSVDQVLAQVEQQKTAAQIANDQRSAALDQNKLILDDDRDRAEAAVTAWVTAYGTAAQHNTPLPSIGEFQAALRPGVTRPGTMPMGAALAPPPTPGPVAMGPPAPALGVPLPGLLPGAAGGRPGGPPGASVAPVPVRPAVAPAVAPAAPPGAISRVPSLPVATPPIATPAGATPALDPATVLAMRRAVMQRGGIGGGIGASILANRAALPPTGGR